MLLLIGVIGLLVTIYNFRLPGVPFFSIITVFNRKIKLTETGSKVYVVFLVVLILGLLLRFGGGSAQDTDASPHSTAGTAQESTALEGEVESKYWRENVEKMVLSRKALFSVLLVAPEMAKVRETIDDCEDKFRTGAENDKRNNRSNSLENAVKACMATAAQMCYSWPDPENGLEPTLACKQLRESQPSLWQWVK